MTAQRRRRHKQRWSLREPTGEPARQAQPQPSPAAPTRERTTAERGELLRGMTLETDLGESARVPNRWWTPLPPAVWSGTPAQPENSRNEPQILGTKPRGVKPSCARRPTLTRQIRFAKVNLRG